MQTSKVFRSDLSPPCPTLGDLGSVHTLNCNFLQILLQNIYFPLSPIYTSCSMVRDKIERNQHFVAKSPLSLATDHVKMWERKNTDVSSQSFRHLKVFLELKDHFLDDWVTWLLGGNEGLSTGLFEFISIAAGFPQSEHSERDSEATVSFMTSSQMSHTV